MDVVSLYLALLGLLTLACLVVGGVMWVKVTMQRFYDRDRRDYIITWPTGLSSEDAIPALGALTGLERLHKWSGTPSTAFETVVRGGVVTYRLVAHDDHAQFLRAQFSGHVQGAAVVAAPPTPGKTRGWQSVAEVSLPASLTIPFAGLEGAARTTSNALQRAQGSSVALVQLVVVPLRRAVSSRGGGAALAATLRVAARADDPSEARAIVADLVRGFTATWQHTAVEVRPATPSPSAHAPLLNPVLTSVLRGMAGAANVRDVLGIRRRSVRSLRRAIASRRTDVFTESTLTPAEVAAVLALPLGGRPVPGVTVAKAPPLFADGSIGSLGTPIAEASYGPPGRVLAIATEDRFRHTLIIGPTGTGKSYEMAGLALGDIAAGHGTGVMGPPDLIEDVLTRIPPYRAGDVYLVEPARSDLAVGFNILRGADPELVSDRVVDYFRSRHGASWGPRTEYWLGIGVRTLAEVPDMTLCELPLLLTNDRFRRSCLDQVDDVTLRRIWDNEYEPTSEAERRKSIAPILNKVQPLLMREVSSAMLSQPTGGLDLERILNTGKIFLVALPQGELGESASLIGSLLFAGIADVAFARSKLPEAGRRPFFLHIDEAAEYAKVPRLGVLLAQVRKYRVGLTLALQYLDQMGELTPDLLYNARNKLTFSTGADDARRLAKEIRLDDPTLIQDLPRHELVLSVTTDAGTSPPATGRPLPLPPSTQLAESIRAGVRQYAIPRHDAGFFVEARHRRYSRDGITSRRQGPPIG